MTLQANPGRAQVRQGAGGAVQADRHAGSVGGLMAGLGLLGAGAGSQIEGPLPHGRLQNAAQSRLQVLRRPVAALQAREADV